MTAPTQQTSVSYNKVAKFLHWTIAIAIIGMLIMGWSFEYMDKGMFKFQMIQLHKSVGITIMLLSVFRLVWRLMHTPPALPPTMKPWEKFVANATHALFYVFMIGMPLVGWAMVSSSPLGLPTILFKTIPWPDLPILPDLANKGEYSHMFFTIHATMALILAALFVMHVGAAWKHHLINRDDVLLRMAPRFMHRPLYAVRAFASKFIPASLRSFLGGDK